MPRAVSDAVVQAARRNRILKDLPDLTLHNALARSTLTNFPHGRKLYRENGPVENVYFPTSGVVSVLVGVHESGDVEMATIGNEGVVGVSVLMGVPRALGRTIFQISGQAIVISARRFDELLRHEQDFSRLIHRYLYAFVRQIMQAGACNRLHTVEERCARWLLMTHDRAGSDEFTLTQNFLAEMMGTRRAAVNLTLATFRRTGALKYVYRRITILDRKQLESFSCPCYNAIHQAYEIANL